MGEDLAGEGDNSEYNDEHTMTLSITIDEKPPKHTGSATPPLAANDSNNKNNVKDEKFNENNTRNNIDYRNNSKEDAESKKHASNGYTRQVSPPEFIRVKSNADIKRDTSGLTTQYIAAGIVNLGAFAAGVCTSWPSSGIPLLHQDPSLQMTESDASWVTSLLCLGACCGSIPAGILSEHFGRKKTLLYLALPMFVSWLLLASSLSCAGVYVGRFVSGIAVGAFSVAIPPYVADISERDSSRALAHFYHVQFAAGILFGYILGLVTKPTILSVLSACLPVVFFVAFIFMPESPVYLLSQGKSSEAKTALIYFRGIDNDIDQEMTIMKDNIKHAFRNKATFKDIFTSKSNLKALFVIFGLMIFQQGSGIYAVVFYAVKILGLCHISMSPTCGAIILGFCLVSASYFSTLLLDKYPRRNLLLLSFGIMAPALISLGVFFHVYYPYPSSNISVSWIPVLSLSVYVTAYAIGVGPIPWLMLREIFPANVTRRATAITAGFHWFLAFVVTKMYQTMVNSIGTGWVLWNFGVNSAVAIFFVYYLVPETYNRTLEVIQNEFNGIHRKKIHRHIIEVESIA